MTPDRLQLCLMATARWATFRWSVPPSTPSAKAKEGRHRDGTRPLYRALRVSREHYARMCNEAGCIGFSVQGAPEPRQTLETKTLNPRLVIMVIRLSVFAIPSGEEPPVVLDAATCIMARLPARGVPEFDALLSTIPAAFFKSIGYTAVAHLLGGGLTGFTEPATRRHRKMETATRRYGPRNKY